jgi:hypothetical protein
MTIVTAEGPGNREPMKYRTCHRAVVLLDRHYGTLRLTFMRVIAMARTLAR